MRDWRCVVTGATSGIGREIAHGLAAAGAALALVCRDRGRGEAVAAELAGSWPDPEIRLFVADLAVLDDVRSVAREIRRHWDRVDVLVNNAGTHDVHPSVSPDGFDRMIATNHLGPFLLTHLLLDPLREGAPSRVVTVASEAHRSVLRLDPYSFADPRPYGPLGSWHVYARSKLLNVLTTQEAARRWARYGVTAHALCPGLVSTGLVRNIPLVPGLLALAEHTPLVRSPAQGARPALRLAGDPEFARRGGGFHSWMPVARLLPPAPLRLRPALRRAVWERSAELVGLRDTDASPAHRRPGRPPDRGPDRTEVTAHE
ncbi:SDR family NAD(P)-dependent oxidoreductase [Streptomyces ziwulingensis]|uniref:SDR family NAD(P)-dependent oxidoreductase n=1 Tax=Streptomyces ziwulingensis TaxID=1045501 RepID=A0ABP9CTI2_9ACTN